MFTKHKLTDPQLVRLSQIVNQRPNLFGGSLAALVRKGLVVEKESTTGLRYGKDCFYNATDAGIAAFTQARSEGW